MAEKKRAVQKHVEAIEMEVLYGICGGVDAQASEPEHDGRR